MDPIVVVGIDFGSTYSGWAYLFKHVYEMNPLKSTTKDWCTNPWNRDSKKGPTCILIKPDGKTIESFGFSAEDEYADKVEDGEQHKWFFFKRFKKMFFKDEDIECNSLLEDECGKKLSAMTVYSLSIDYLKKDALDSLTKSTLCWFGVSEIRWVLTVPALWNDAAKQFIREAAEKAGIPGKNLTVCLEPEAALVYCRHFLKSKSSVGGEKASLEQFWYGTNYMVLDAGGEAVDVSVYKVSDNGELKELYKASVGVGGANINHEFEAFLERIIGSNVMKKFKIKHLDDYTYVVNQFERKKREISPAKQNKMTIRMPASLSALCTEIRGKSLKDLGLKSRLGDKGEFKSEFDVDYDIISEFFQPSVQRIVPFVKSILMNRAFKCSAILMVGGFSESPMLREKMSAEFFNIRIIVPEDADIAVLKGAVIVGHDPSQITKMV